MNARRSFQLRRPEPASTGVLDQFLPEDGRPGLEDAPRAFEVTNDDSLDRVRSVGRLHHVRTPPEDTLVRPYALRHLASLPSSGFDRRDGVPRRPKAS